MTEEQKLVSDLAECHPDLGAWAQDKIREGKTVAEITAMMRDVARLINRN